MELMKLSQGDERNHDLYVVHATPPTHMPPAHVTPAQNTASPHDVAHAAQTPPPHTQPAAAFDGDAPVDLEPDSAPEFPLSAVSHLPWLRDWIAALAEAYQTPLDLPGILTLGAIAGAMQRRVVVSPREGWVEPINIYSVVALPPGTNKSQVHREVMKPILQWESQYNDSTRAERSRASEREKLMEAKIEKLRTLAAKPTTRKEEADAAEYEIARLKAELESLPRCNSIQLIYDDTTSEALEKRMAENGHAIVASAEGKLFDNMAGVYGGAPNINVYLKAHAGDPITVNRIGRERITIEEPRLTLLMTVQPQVIEGLATKREFDGRGLLARLLYSIPKSNIGRRNVRPDPVPLCVSAAYCSAIESLLENGIGSQAQGERAREITFSPEAEDQFYTMRGEIEERLAPEAMDLNGMGGWANKLAGLVARLAAVLHCARYIDEPWATPIEADTMASAITLGRYAIEHARAAFGIMRADPQIEKARHLRDGILRLATEKGTLVLSRRNVHQSVRSLGRLADLNVAAGILKEHGYITIFQEKGGNHKDRVVYQMNPKWPGLPASLAPHLPDKLRTATAGKQCAAGNTGPANTEATVISDKYERDESGYCTWECEEWEQ